MKTIRITGIVLMTLLVSAIFSISIAEDADAKSSKKIKREGKKAVNKIHELGEELQDVINQGLRDLAK